MTAKERLIIFLDEKGIGQNAFEKKVGIANGYISHNKGSIGSKIISNISLVYPELNIVWLQTGIGNMLNDDMPQPPRQLELDFSKVADACQRSAATAETLANSNSKLVDTNSKLVEDNTKVLNLLVESIIRIEKKIDQKGGAMSESRGML